MVAWQSVTRDVERRERIPLNYEQTALSRADSINYEMVASTDLPDVLPRLGSTGEAVKENASRVCLLFAQHRVIKRTIHFVFDSAPTK